jgi:hypothetical protein
MCPKQFTTHHDACTPSAWCKVNGACWTVPQKQAFPNASSENTDVVANSLFLVLSDAFGNPGYVAGFLQA